MKDSCPVSIRDRNESLFSSFAFSEWLPMILSRWFVAIFRDDCTYSCVFVKLLIFPPAFIRAKKLYTIFNSPARKFRKLLCSNGSDTAIEHLEWRLGLETPRLLLTTEWRGFLSTGSAEPPPALQQAKSLPFSSAIHRCTAGSWAFKPWSRCNWILEKSTFS